MNQIMMMGMKYLYTSICGVQTARKYVAINYTCITIQLDFGWKSWIDVYLFQIMVDDAGLVMTTGV